ncbi:type II toxin-antitoxin system prevent-host-death family antitoxin [Streptacidiphilus sp. PAMC 29251]
MKEPSIELSVAQTRARLADVLNDASARDRITYVTSRGRRVAAVVPLAIAEAADLQRSSESSA